MAVVDRHLVVIRFQICIFDILNTALLFFKIKVKVL